MVLTITPRTPKIAPRSSKSPPRPDLLSERGVYKALKGLIRPLGAFLKSLREGSVQGSQTTSCSYKLL